LIVLITNKFAIELHFVLKMAIFWENFTENLWNTFNITLHDIMYSMVPWGPLSNMVRRGGLCNSSQM